MLKSFLNASDPISRPSAAAALHHPWLVGEIPKGLGSFAPSVRSVIEMLQAAVPMSVLKRVSLKWLAYCQLDMDQGTIPQAFAYLDKNRFGSITSKGLESLKEEIPKEDLFHEMTEKSLEDIIRKYNHPRDYSHNRFIISYSDFLAFTQEEKAITNPENLWFAFRNIGITGEGYVTTEELYQLSEKMGLSIAREDIANELVYSGGRMDYVSFNECVSKEAITLKKILALPLRLP